MRFAQSINVLLWKKDQNHSFCILIPLSIINKDNSFIIGKSILIMISDVAISKTILQFKIILVAKNEEMTLKHISYVIRILIHLIIILSHPSGECLEFL